MSSFHFVINDACLYSDQLLRSIRDKIYGQWRSVSAEVSWDHFAAALSCRRHLDLPNDVLRSVLAPAGVRFLSGKWVSLV
jgi:hypothetical protein